MRVLLLIMLSLLLSGCYGGTSREELVKRKIQVVCTSAIDGSVIKSVTANTWYSYDRRIGYHGMFYDDRMDVEFIPRIGDSCELKSL